MSSTVTLACTKIAMVSEQNPNQNYSGQNSYKLAYQDGDNYLLISFAALPSNLRDYAISRVKLTIQGISAPAHSNTVTVGPCSEAFTSGSVTWNTKPRKVLLVDETKSFSSGSSNLTMELYPESSANWRLVDWLLAPSMQLSVFNLSSYGDVFLSGSLNDYILEVTYNSDVTVACQVNAGAMNGIYVNPRLSRWMTWTLSKAGSLDSFNSAQGFSQASAVFFWREQGASSWNSIQISGSTMRVDIPPNTLPAQKTVQYYVRVITNYSTTVDSSIFSFSTTDSAISVTLLSPISTVEDGSSAITFRWSYSSPNGTTPTKYDLWWKVSTAGNWTQINNLPGNSPQYTMPAGTLPAGEIVWIVRAYNADSVAGNWSLTNGFTCIAAPDAPRVSCNGVPFATILWQVSGQQAWRLSVDGKNYGTHFGTGKSFTLPDYLQDGVHTATVEVQGQYGLWSQPGTVTFNVNNTPGSPVQVEGNFDVDAELSWETGSQTADFLIYRDGVRIGHTTGNSFADRFVLGQHSWRIVNRLSSGNYTASNEVSGALRSCVTRVAPVAGGDWLPLPLSERSSPEQKFSYARRYSLRHMLGSELPVLELSPYVDGSGTYEAAFRSVPELQAFEALLGQVVIIKSRGGRVLIGALADVTTRFATFYIAAEFTLQRCHWEDYVDDENS